jgi:hypothetical protein
MNSLRKPAIQIGKFLILSILLGVFLAKCGYATHTPSPFPTKEIYDQEQGS